MAPIEKSVCLFLVRQFHSIMFRLTWFLIFNITVQIISITLTTLMERRAKFWWAGIWRNGDAGCQIHVLSFSCLGSQTVVGKQRETWLSPFGAEVDTNLGANPLHSTQQLGKEETGNFCWSWGAAAFIYAQTVSPTVYSLAPDNFTAKLSSPLLCSLTRPLTPHSPSLSLSHSTTQTILRISYL